MSLKSNSKEIVAIAQEIAERKELDIKELVETNNMKELNAIWIEAVEEYDKRNLNSDTEI